MYFMINLGLRQRLGLLIEMDWGATDQWGDTTAACAFKCSIFEPCQCHGDGPGTSMG